MERKERDWHKLYSHPVYKDLELETKFEVRHIYPSLQFVMPFPDGKSLAIYSDPELTCKSIEKFSKRDAKSYRDLFARSRKMVDEFIAPATYAPPLPALEAVVKMQSSDIGREIMEFSDKSPKINWIRSLSSPRRAGCGSTGAFWGPTLP